MPETALTRKLDHTSVQQRRLVATPCTGLAPGALCHSALCRGDSSASPEKSYAPRGSSPNLETLAGSRGQELRRPQAELAWLGDSPLVPHEQPSPALPASSPLLKPLTSIHYAPNTFSANCGLSPPHLGSHLFHHLQPSSRLAPSPRGGSARQSSPAPLGKLGAVPLPPRSWFSQVPSCIPATPQGVQGGALDWRNFLGRKGWGLRDPILTPGSALGAILWLSQPHRLGASESWRSLPPLPPAPPPCSAQPWSRAGLEPPAPTPRARFIQLHSSAPGLM